MFLNKTITLSKKSKMKGLINLWTITESIKDRESKIQSIKGLQMKNLTNKLTKTTIKNCIGIFMFELIPMPNR